MRDTELHNFGLVLPDFVRNFIKGKKLQPALEEEKTESLDWLRLGSNKHFERDKKFHASTYFTNTTKKITEVIRPEFIKAGIPRDWFAAHVLTEMLIDRVLIKEAPALANNFYLDIEKSDTKSIVDFLSSRQIAETDIFLQRLERFNQAKYLLQYVHNKAMVFSLNHIFKYTGADGEWTPRQFEIIENIIPLTEQVIANDLHLLKEEMR